MENEIFIKIYDVIHSCRTLPQLYVALEYLELAARNGYIDPVFKTAIYTHIYLDKYKELDN